MTLLVFFEFPHVENNFVVKCSIKNDTVCIYIILQSGGVLLKQRSQTGTLKPK